MKSTYVITNKNEAMNQRSMNPRHPVEFADHLAVMLGISMMGMQKLIERGLYRVGPPSHKLVDNPRQLYILSQQLTVLCASI